MRRKFGSWSGVMLGLVLAAGASADVGLGVKAGTLGPGVDLTVGLSEALNIRVGWNKFQYDYDTTLENDNGSAPDDLSAKLDLETVPVLLDWHLFQGGFRFSGGVVFNSNKILLSAKPGDTIDFNDIAFQVDSVTGGADFEAVALYLGLGVGNAVSSDGNWNFVFDLGVMFQGEPEITLNAVAANPALQAALNEAVEAERLEVQDDASAFQYYPVLAIGISYKF